MQCGDQLYAFTDGYKDQFGGDKQKKLKISGFREQLARFAHLPMPDQSQALRDFFNHWKSGHEQVDDVCVVGVRV